VKKLRILLYILKQGLRNIYKNVFMIFASVCVITVSLFILGAIDLATINLQGIVDEINKRPEIQINCKTEATNMETTSLEAKIKNDSRVQSVVTISKAENFQKFLEYFKDNKELFTGYKEDFLYVSYEVKMKNSIETKNFVEDIQKVNGVDKVEYSWQQVTFLTSAQKGVRFFGAASLSVMAIISLLLIINTIKLTAYARKKELEIMKYVGASDSYIRGPFIIEGVFIGTISAVLSYFAIHWTYINIEKYINSSMVSNGINLIKVIEFRNFGTKLLMEFFVAGIVVCIVGTVVSIRKYIKV